MGGIYDINARNASAGCNSMNDLLSPEQRQALAELDKLKSAIAKGLSYNPETGEFINKIMRSGHAKKGEVAGNLSQLGYIRIWIAGRSYYAHTLAFVCMEGRFPLPGHEIDHINHDKSDNRWSNLREVKRAENHRNKELQSNNTTGMHGLYWSVRDKVWTARITVDGRGISLGTFKSKFDACCARKSAEKKYGFHSNHGKKVA